MMPSWLRFCGAGNVKTELVARLAARHPHLKRDDVEHFVSAALRQITDALAAGRRVELRGFGVFTARTRSARTGRNPRTGESVVVSEKRLPFFKTGKDLHKRLNDSPKNEKKLLSASNGSGLSPVLKTPS
jgi:integration host factor subunit beta